ncbi:MAG: penicillin-binding protein 2 [Bdellovibrionales bacterium]
MRGDSERARLFTRRAVLLGAAQCGLFSLLAGRLYYLQIVEGGKYRTLAEENRINVRLIAPPRGRILDRSGRPLAVNEQNYRVVLLPEQIANLNDLLDRLSGYIQITEADRKRIARDLKYDRELNAVLVRDNLTWEQVAQISLYMPDLPGIDIDKGEVRSYPYGEATSHMLGYVGVVTENEAREEEGLLAIPGFRIGKNGIEKQHDAVLRGEAGNVQMEVNARGRVVRELARNEPQPGQDVALTIDIGLQQFVYRRLAEQQGAAAVVMDVVTGAVYALVSQPGFDPNLFTYGISQDDWDRLNGDEHAPLLNKAISGVYAPGSAFKPVVAMAGLEAKLLDPNATVYCPGFLDLGSYRFHCWKHGGHGHVNFVQAMAGSCDTYFYDLGKRVGIDRIQAMALRFGLGQKLGVDLPHERAGLVPTRAWKLATQGQAWQQGETLVAAIGQGYMLASPLQLAVMAARIANGGRAIKPFFFREQEQERGEAPSLGFDPAHIAAVQQSMSAVVNETIGTAYGARIADWDMAMAGKTGTAQVRHISLAERQDGVVSNEKLPWKERDHALFAGFAPVDAPRYAVAVIVEHGGSGAHVAAPLARDILLECQKRKIS